MCMSALFGSPSPPQIQAPPPAPDPVKPMVNPEGSTSNRANAGDATSRRKLRSDLPQVDTGAGLTIPA